MKAIELYFLGYVLLVILQLKKALTAKSLGDGFVRHYVRVVQMKNICKEAHPLYIYNMLSSLTFVAFGDEISSSVMQPGMNKLDD